MDWEKMLGDDVRRAMSADPGALRKLADIAEQIARAIESPADGLNPAQRDIALKRYAAVIRDFGHFFRGAAVRMDALEAEHQIAPEHGPRQR